MMITKKIVESLSQEAKDIFAKEYTGRGKKIASYINVANSFIASGLFVDVIHMSPPCKFYDIKAYLKDIDIRILQDFFDNIINAYAKDIITAETTYFQNFIEYFNFESLEKLFEIAKQKVDLKVLTTINGLWIKYVDFSCEQSVTKYKARQKDLQNFIASLLTADGNESKFYNLTYRNMAFLKDYNNNKFLQDIVVYLAKEGNIKALNVVNIIYDKASFIFDIAIEQATLDHLEVEQTQENKDFVKQQLFILLDKTFKSKTITPELLKVLEQDLLSEYCFTRLSN